MFIYLNVSVYVNIEQCWWPLTLVSVQPFGNILNLVPLAESVVKLNAVCMQCFKEAAYTKRLGAEQEVRTKTILPSGPVFILTSIFDLDLKKHSTFFENRLILHLP